MAERLSSEFRVGYPWAEWTDGNSWLVKKGSDYHCTTKSFRAMLHNKAAEQKLKVHTRIMGDQVIFQFKDSS